MADAAAYAVIEGWGCSGEYRWVRSGERQRFCLGTLFIGQSMKKEAHRPPEYILFPRDIFFLSFVIFLVRMSSIVLPCIKLPYTFFYSPINTCHSNSLFSEKPADCRCNRIAESRLKVNETGPKSKPESSIVWPAFVNNILRSAKRLLPR